MKLKTNLAIVSGLTLGLVVGSAMAGTNAHKVIHKSTHTALSTQQDKISYSIGADLGQKFKQQKITVNPDIFLQGFKDATGGDSSLLTKEEMVSLLRDFQKTLAERHAKEFKTLSETNAKEGETFLAENKNKPGIVTLPSGLQYQIVKPGSGEHPKATDTVTTHYRGALIDGTEFDSTYNRGKPAEFPVDGVIAGWSEALQLMQPGAKWKLFVPSNLAYGIQGAGNRIGPNKTLVFDIELLNVKPKETEGKKK